MSSFELRKARGAEKGAVTRAISQLKDVVDGPKNAETTRVTKGRLQTLDVAVKKFQDALSISSDARR